MVALEGVGFGVGRPGPLALALQRLRLFVLLVPCLFGGLQGVVSHLLPTRTGGSNQSKPAIRGYLTQNASARETSNPLIWRVTGK